jgi:DNA-binding MarR family transcriptional regulator
MEFSPEPMRDMSLLEQIEQDPNITQASLADQLGVAVGTVNWHLKRLIAKGYVKVKRAERRKLRYIITPEGIAHRAHLTVDYIEQSMLMYRNIRQRTRELLGEARRLGYNRVYIQGTGDIVDICRLTCLEMNFQVEDGEGAPHLEVNGVHIHLRLNGQPAAAGQKERGG